MLKRAQQLSLALVASSQSAAAHVYVIKAFFIDALTVVLKDPEVILMGMVVMTYKLNPDSDVEDVDSDSIAEAIRALRTENYDVQKVETKPLAFGLKFVQVHVTMNDGEGLADAFEAQMSAIHGVGEIEVLSMGLI